MSCGLVCKPTCERCRPKFMTCPQCERTISLLLPKCPLCGRAITEDDRSRRYEEWRAERVGKEGIAPA